jgi:hypothetical protein
MAALAVFGVLIGSNAMAGIGLTTEQECRGCHNMTPDDPPGIPVEKTFLPDRHHQEVGTAIIDPSDIYNNDRDEDGVYDTIYNCLNCHDTEPDPVNEGEFNLVVFNDCLFCHQVDDGINDTHDADADGLLDASDNCPVVFNLLSRIRIATASVMPVMVFTLMLILMAMMTQ